MRSKTASAVSDNIARWTQAPMSFLPYPQAAAIAPHALAAETPASRAIAITAPDSPRSVPVSGIHLASLDIPAPDKTLLNARARSDQAPKPFEARARKLRCARRASRLADHSGEHRSWLRNASMPYSLPQY